MVLLKYLNSLCRPRIVATTAPAQVACRLLGNTEKPCTLDPLCRHTQTRGISFFYAVWVTVFSAVFLFLYWGFRLTRLSFLVRWGVIFVAKPLQAVLAVVMAVMRFFDTLES
jgi:hypothetical protein